jgi:hypothetical protein
LRLFYRGKELLDDTSLLGINLIRITQLNSLDNAVVSEAINEEGITEKIDIGILVYIL